MIGGLVLDCFGVLYLPAAVAGKDDLELVLNERLLAYAQSLRPGVKLGMLSNIAPGAMDRYFSPGQRRRLFDAVVLSGEEGLSKPHPSIYKIMAERLNLAAGECLLVDDSLDNCSGAAAAGMDSLLFQNTRQAIDEIRRRVIK